MALGVTTPVQCFCLVRSVDATFDSGNWATVPRSRFSIGQQVAGARVPKGILGAQPRGWGAACPTRRSVLDAGRRPETFARDTVGCASER